MLSLPLPSLEARTHSETLCQHIKAAIIRAGGHVPFSQFMEMALYTPGLGYYHSGKTVFGRAGDFITAPELSPLFGRCIGDAIMPALQQYPTILELGAGSGKLAATLLHHCENIQQYFILEPSSALQQLQQHALQQQCAMHFHKIHWLTTLPENFCGTILANEVMDALPATRFRWENGTVQEYAVSLKQNQFAWQYIAPPDQYVQNFVQQLNLPSTIYHSELQLWLQPWIASLAQCLQRGIILLFDYGFPRHEFYHPDRCMGTLMCHYQHHAHSDPFFYPGLQDITVHTDFTAVAEAAVANHLHVAGYTSQAAFLLENHLLDKAHSLNDRQQIKMLTLPQEMGELFKAMLLTRDWDRPIAGFQLQDRRHRL